MEDKREVVKHSSAIQIENAITLLQRRAWNVLLANAYDELPTEESHHLGVKELAQTLGYNSRNDVHLKETLKELIKTVVEWNVVGKDRTQVWGAATLLAEVEIEEGICTYAFGPRLRRSLHNPKMYARISLSIQNQFSSKHALALYELFVDYLHPDRTHGETPFIRIPDFRKLMGLSDTTYPEFKKLNKWVIKDPIAEINQVTDLQVTPEYRKQGKSVAAVKFRFQRVLPIAETSADQERRFPELGDLPEIVTELRDAGLSVQDAWDVWHQGFGGVEAAERPTDTEFDTYIREKIDLLKRRHAAGKVESVTGFLLAAIKKNYANPEWTKQIETEQRSARSRGEAEHARQEEEWRQQFEDFRAERFWAHFRARPPAWQDAQRQVFLDKIKGDADYRFL